MASSTPVVIIEPAGDAMITLCLGMVPITTFQVCRRVVGDLKLGYDRTIDLHWMNHSYAQSVELLLRCMSVSNGQCLPPESYALSIDEVWRVLKLVDISGRQYFRRGHFSVPSSVLRKWFSVWFNSQPEKQWQDACESLLYPAFAIRDSQCFATITKWLAYNAKGKIAEQNPLNPWAEESVSCSDMHLPVAILNAIDRAVRLVKTNIRKRLNLQIRKVNNASRPLVEALAKPTICMLKDSSVSTNEALTTMSTIFGGISPEGAENCHMCRMLIDAQEEGFEGLCLHCKDISIEKPKRYNTLPSDFCKWHGEMMQRLRDVRGCQLQTASAAFAAPVSTAYGSIEDEDGWT